MEGCGLPVYQTPSGSCCKNEHGGAEVLDAPPRPVVKPAPAPAPVKKEEPKPAATKPVAQEEKPKAEEKFDFSEVNPEDWECFGQIDVKHSECKSCPFMAKCASKAGVKI